MDQTLRSSSKYRIRTRGVPMEEVEGDEENEDDDEDEE